MKEERFLKSPRSSEKAAKIRYEILYWKQGLIEPRQVRKNSNDSSQDKSMERSHCSQDSSSQKNFATTWHAIVAMNSTSTHISWRFPMATKTTSPSASDAEQKSNNTLLIQVPIQSESTQDWTSNQEEQIMNI